MRLHRSYWTVLTAAVLAAAVLFFALSLQEDIRRDLHELLGRWGADILFASTDERPTAETFEQLESDPAIAEFAIEGSSSLSIRPGDAFYITWLKVSPNYPAVVRPPLASGRLFDASDGRVAVLGSEVKEVVFGDIDPIGQRIRGVEIVGVLAKIPAEDRVRERFNRLVLTPFAPSTESKWGQYGDSPFLYVRASGSRELAESAVLEHIPGATVTPISQRLAGSFYQLRSLTRVLLLCGLAVTLVATLLVGAMLTLSALRRRREMGIRRAIGGARSNVFRHVIVEGVSIALVGALAGMGIGAAVTAGVEGAIHLSVEHLLLPVGALLLGFAAAFAPALGAAMGRPIVLLGRRGLFASRHAGRVIRAFVILAFAVASAAAILVGNLTVASHRFAGDAWGDIDERTMLVRDPRQSILPSPEMSLEDADLLRDTKGVELVVPYAWGTVRSDTPAGRSVMAPSEEYLDLGLFQITAGRDLVAADFNPGVRHCLVSSWHAQDRGIATGDRIQVGSLQFEVVGTFNDNRHEIPADMVFPERYKGTLGDHLGRFLVRVSTEADPESVKSRIRVAFAERYPNMAQVEVFSVNARAIELGSFFRSANVRFALTTLFLLLLAVFEANAHGRFILAQRIRALGVRRSLGASPLRVALGAWRESAMVTAFGVALGALAAHFTIDEVLAWFYLLKRPPIYVTLASAAIAVMLIAGLGALPVRSALALTPSDMLRRGKV